MAGATAGGTSGGTSGATSDACCFALPSEVGCSSTHLHLSSGQLPAAQFGTHHSDKRASPEMLTHVGQPSFPDSRLIGGCLAASAEVSSPWGRGTAGPSSTSASMRTGAPQSAGLPRFEFPKRFVALFGPPKKVEGRRASASA